MKVSLVSLFMAMGSLSYAMEGPYLGSKVIPQSSQECLYSQKQQTIKNCLFHIHEFLREIVGINEKKDKIYLEKINGLSGLDSTVRDQIRLSLSKKNIGFFLEYDKKNIKILKNALNESGFVDSKKATFAQLVKLNAWIDIISEIPLSVGEFLTQALTMQDLPLPETVRGDLALKKCFLEQVRSLNQAIIPLTRTSTRHNTASIAMLPFFDNHDCLKIQGYKLLEIGQREDPNAFLNHLKLEEILQSLSYFHRALSEFNPNYLSKNWKSDRFAPSLSPEKIEPAIMNALTLVENLRKITIGIMALYYPVEMNKAVPLIQMRHQRNLDRFMAFKERKEVWILCLDGGGIKGLLGAVLLDILEKRTGKSIHDLFDFFAGTSTGGLQTLGLTFPLENGMDQPQYGISFVRNLYENDGGVIFPPKDNLSKQVSQMMNYAYDPAPFEDKLVNYFSNLDLSSATKPTLVTAMSLTQEKTEYLTSYSSLEKKGQGIIKTWQSARATSAAPTYFPPLTLFYNNEITELVDGGMTTNNPVLPALTEVIRLCPSLKKIVILSLGTGNKGAKHTYGDVNSGLMAFRNMTKIAMSANNHKNEEIAKMFLEMIADAKGIESHFIRINPEIGKNIKMDDPSKQNLAQLIEIAHKTAQNDEGYNAFIDLVKGKTIP